MFRVSVRVSGMLRFMGRAWAKAKVGVGIGVGLGLGLGL